MENEKLALLHDHYKETFSYIRDRERQRDRLFLVVIGLFGLLTTAILFSAGFSIALKEVGIAGSKADLSSLPAGAILGATWVFTLAMTLRYCQVCIVVERQYPYLHTLGSKYRKSSVTTACTNERGEPTLKIIPRFHSGHGSVMFTRFPCSR
jgi:hypothetical protein